MTVALTHKQAETLTAGLLAGDLPSDCSEHYGSAALVQGPGLVAQRLCICAW